MSQEKTYLVVLHQCDDEPKFIQATLDEIVEEYDESLKSGDATLVDGQIVKYLDLKSQRKSK